MSITLENVSKSFGKQCLFNSVSLTIPQGSRVCIAGKSGIGKTTLLRMICGLDTDFDGRIIVEKVCRFSCDFQEDRLLPWYTAEENLHLVQKDCLIVSKILQDAGLENAAGKYPDELSGGMRRRIALLRALIYHSDVLVLDEPVREMDAATAQIMLKMVEKYLGGRTLLLVTHDLSQAEQLGCNMFSLDSFSNL